MNEIGVAHFLDQIVIDGLRLATGAFLKTQAAGGNEIQTEEVTHEFLKLAVGQLGFMTQIECGGFGGGADGGERELSFEGSEDFSPTSGTPRGLVNPMGHDGAGAQDDVFLEIGRATELALIGRLLAMGANAGSGAGFRQHRHAKGQGQHHHQRNTRGKHELQLGDSCADLDCKMKRLTLKPRLMTEYNALDIGFSGVSSECQ